VRKEGIHSRVREQGKTLMINSLRVEREGRKGLKRLDNAVILEILVTSSTRGRTGRKVRAANLLRNI